MTGRVFVAGFWGPLRNGCRGNCILKFRSVLAVAYFYLIFLPNIYKKSVNTVITQCCCVYGLKKGKKPATRRAFLYNLKANRGLHKQKNCNDPATVALFTCNGAQNDQKH